jgi:MFS superfamily sulfate permease-like transporter
VEVSNYEGKYLIKFKNNVSFLNKSLLRSWFSKIPDGSSVVIDGTESEYIDHDIMESVEDFLDAAIDRNIVVEIRKSENSANAFFRR